MATVRLEFSPEPAHVRTARLIGVAMARKARLPEERLDEVRLAIGEACGRAVTRTLRHGLRTPVVVEMRDDNTLADMEDEITVEASLAILSSLAEELQVTSAENGTGSVVRMSWAPRQRRTPR